jgi:hypothetical protein
MKRILDFFKKDSFDYLNYGETNTLIDKHFDDKGPSAIQNVWIEMIKLHLKNKKPVISVPYKGMIFIINGNNTQFIGSNRFKKVFNENLIHKNDVVRQYWFGPFDLIKNPPTQVNIVSQEFPDWLPSDLKGNFMFLILLNVGAVFRHISSILKKNDVAFNDDIRTFYKNHGKIKTQDDIIINIEELTKNLFINGFTIDMYESFIEGLIKHKKSTATKTRYLGKCISTENRLRGF